mmetsp:Transcript_9500/g.14552  ORF Transcript_9500/g.14552 Transcript_9500/m.14552 type:complete len:272 (-) Transcript_9500:554-1369(-)|eukprot:CAMPEP_0202699636 /NCGR_PEP_ID=MMETSP1385-20130828/12857_1 /ASSEMBLY_ACC=CAM_ASM_000861 /TAXON_ID=933848 /ORGANISM="Elphidium margaritaceum" /LENGTH=271 /DNA_ID=CAMNT_0049356619 /DNA_START=16 /DNA_END=831 /DNA_ORIENTATION=+
MAFQQFTTSSSSTSPSVSLASTQNSAPRPIYIDVYDERRFGKVPEVVPIIPTLAGSFPTASRSAVPATPPTPPVYTAAPLPPYAPPPQPIPGHRLVYIPPQTPVSYSNPYSTPNKYGPSQLNMTSPPSQSRLANQAVPFRRSRTRFSATRKIFQSPPSAPDNAAASDSICWTYRNTGYCKYGAACFWKHDDTAPDVPASVGAFARTPRTTRPSYSTTADDGNKDQKTMVCWDFNTSKGCRRQNCRWLHESVSDDNSVHPCTGEKLKNKFGK